MASATGERGAVKTHYDTHTLKALPIEGVARRLEMDGRGGRFWCPSCQTDGASQHKTPDLATRSGRFHCFKCRERGDTIALVQLALRANFREACDWLCREFNVPVKDGLPQGYAKRGTPRRKPASEDTARKRETPEEICEVYEDLLERCPLTPEAIAYGEGREWTRTLLERFGIVAIDNPEKLYRDLLDEHGTESLKAAGLINRADRFHFERHRLIFPFYSRRSFRVEYLQARRIEGNEEPRYMGAILGGQDRLMPCLWNDISLSQLEPGSEVHICEGIPDALTLEAAGLRALACLGVSNLSEDFIKDLLRFDVVLAADRDEQGTRFNEEAAERFGRYGVRVSVSQPPEGFKDWNEYRNRGKQE